MLLLMTLFSSFKATLVQMDNFVLIIELVTWAKLYKIKGDYQILFTFPNGRHVVETCEIEDFVIN